MNFNYIAPIKGILAILVSKMSSQKSFFLSRCISPSCTDTFERRHWSFYVYVCYENSVPVLKRKLRPWESNRLHPAILVSRGNPEDSNRLV